MRKKTNNIFSRLAIGFSFALLMVLASPLLFSQDVAAVAQETCPDGGDWVKVDGIDAQSYNYVAPEGKEVVEVCYKAGTTVKYETIDPPQSSVTVTTDVPNPNDNAFQNISHASFRLADEEKEQDPLPLTLVGECLGDGYIEWKVTNPNDFIVQFSWETNDNQSGNSQAPANSFVTFKTASTGKTVSLSYSLDEEPVKTEKTVKACEEEKDPEELILMGECLNDGSIEWKVTNPNDFAVTFSWETNDNQSGNSEVPANSFVTFKTASTGNMVTLSYSLDEEPVKTEKTIEACDDPKEENPGELTLVGECQNDGSIEWKVTNPNDFAIQFSWKTNDNQSGDSEVPANGVVSFSTTTGGSMIYLSYSLENEPMSLEQSVVVCDDSKEEPKESVDPEPDMPAGGMAPSLLTSVAPFLIGIGGASSLAALVIKSKKNKVKITFK